MQVIKEYDSIYTLFDASWSGALETLNRIKEADKGEEFMEHLEMVFDGDIPTDTALNDYIWFDSDTIFEELGILEEEESEEENGEEK